LRGDVRATVRKVLVEQGIRPVLVDVGASMQPPRIWDSIAPNSIYVGFDPDGRTPSNIVAEKYHRAEIVPKAIVDVEGQQETTFFLTKHPECSSSLRPDFDSLSNYLFADCFKVEQEVSVPATTLNAAIGGLNLPGIDWLKLDTQGTDLRIFRSLTPDLQAKVLALDIEPGLIDAYEGEDLFIDCHRYLTENGFWLSNLNVRGPVRMRSSTLTDCGSMLTGMTRDSIENVIRKSPGWCEARYLRMPGWLAERSCAMRDIVLLWAISMLDRQHGFALDVEVQYRTTWGGDATSETMEAVSTRCIRRLLGTQRLLANLSCPTRVGRRILRL